MGGCSAAKATGSALRVSAPEGVTSSYLYLAPAATPGTNSSQIPEEPRARIGCSRPSQELKSPTTRTARALGAQTANAVPATPSTVISWAPSFCHSRSCRPSPSRYWSSSPMVGQNR